MVQIHEKLEAFYSFFGMLTGLIFLIISILSTPGYDPIYDTVSSLGEGDGKFFFSIAFIIGGSSGIPLYLYLEREFTNVNVTLRKLATGFSISACICIALVGIIPDESYIDLFRWFHGIISFYAFIGAGIYIFLYSLIIFLNPKEVDFYKMEFQGYLAAIGFVTFIFLILLIIFLRPIIEWMLTILIISWILLTSLHLITTRFINIPITELRKLNYEVQLQIFKNLSKSLEEFNLKNDLTYKTIQQNIKLLHSKVEQENKNRTI